jgi:hypothetical protein
MVMMTWNDICRVMYANLYFWIKFNLTSQQSVATFILHLKELCV